MAEASLVEARLDQIRDDFFEVLKLAKNEIPGLRKAIIEGKINGSVYEGECACLVGTIAKVRACNYKEMRELKPDSTRPIECFFMAIYPGHTPENNQISKIVLEWLEQFVEKEK